MREQTLVVAIDNILSHVPKLDDQFWIDYGKAVNTRLKALSGGEQRIYDFCLSLWDGSRSVDMRDLINGVSKEVLTAIIESMQMFANDL